MISGSFIALLPITVSNLYGNFLKLVIFAWFCRDAQQHHVQRSQQYLLTFSTSALRFCGHRCLDRKSRGSASSFRDHKLAENQRLAFPWPILKFLMDVARFPWKWSNGQWLVGCNDLELWCSIEVDAEPVLYPMYHLRLTVSFLSCFWNGLVEGHCLSTGIIKLGLASTLVTIVQIGLKWLSSAVTCCACFELPKCFILFFIVLEPCILFGHLS